MIVYPKYKSSNFDWLGDVPESWNTVPAKALFADRSTLSKSHDVHLTPSQHYGVLAQDEYMQRSGNKVVLNLSGADNMRHVEAGDFISHLRSFQGGLEYSRLAGKVSAAYTVLRPRTELIGDYFRYLFKSRMYVQGLQTTTDQLRDGQSIRYGQFARLGLPFPPLEDQRHIADYLDRETGKIDRLINKQEQLVERLLERRRALTRRALSRGLAEREELRDSGVGWLGTVPSRWTVQPLGRLITVTSGFPFKSELFTSDPENTRLLRGVNVNPGATKWGEVVRWQRESNDGLDEYELSVGDIVLGLDRPIVSAGVRIARIEKSDLPALVLQRVARIRPRTGLDASFAYLLLSAQAFVDYLTPIFTGVSVPHMSPDQLKRYTVAIPPLDEQIEIVRHVDQSNHQIGQLIDKASAAIQLLRERRQALISAAVTGKIDVRGL